MSGDDGVEPADAVKSRWSEEVRESFSDRQRHGREACAALIGRCTVFVVPGEPKSHQEFQPGTGVLLATPRGTPYLLTAAHVVEDASGQPVKRLAISSDLLDPLRIDAAVLLGPMRPDCHSANHARVDVAAVSLVAVRSQVAPLLGAAVDADPAVGPDDLMVLSGFPAGLCRYNPVGPRLLDVDLVRALYMTRIEEGRDPFGRFRLRWDEAQAVWGVPKTSHLTFETGDRFELGRPHGISGGGLWRIRSPQSPTELWSPSSHCQVVGVASAVSGKDELIEPSALWFDWLREAEAELDLRAGLPSEIAS